MFSLIFFHNNFALHLILHILADMEYFIIKSLNSSKVRHQFVCKVVM